MPRNIDIRASRFGLVLPVFLAFAPACVGGDGLGTTSSETESDSGDTSSGDASSTSTTTTSDADEELVPYRIQSMSLHDPPLYLSECDEEATPLFDAHLLKSITSDTDDPVDGILNYSHLIGFDALDLDGGTLVSHDDAICTSLQTCDPLLMDHGLSCYWANNPFQCVFSAAEQLDPPIAPIDGQCFATEPHEVPVARNFAGLKLTMHSYALAGGFTGDPPEALTDGVMGGFVLLEDAMNTMIPSGVDTIGGAVLADHLCLDDMDEYNGTPGYWFGFTFTAEKVSVEDHDAGATSPR